MTWCIQSEVGIWKCECMNSTCIVLYIPGDSTYFQSCCLPSNSKDRLVQILGRSDKVCETIGYRGTGAVDHCE